MATALRDILAEVGTVYQSKQNSTVRASMISLGQE